MLSTLIALDGGSVQDTITATPLLVPLGNRGSSIFTAFALLLLLLLMVRMTTTWVPITPQGFTLQTHLSLQENFKQNSDIFCSANS